MSAEQLDLLTPPEAKYQPRWLAWCAATGHDPDVFDGHRTGSKFIVWISRNLAAWHKENDVLDEWAPLTDDNHESFTAYLFSLSAATPARPAADQDPGADPDTAPGSPIATSRTTPPASTWAGRDVSRPGEPDPNPGSACAGGESESGAPRMGPTAKTTTTQRCSAGPSTP